MVTSGLCLDRRLGLGLALVKAIDTLVNTGHAPYPVERTLLTTGILDAVMTSKHEGNKRIETPHLAIKYTPVDYPFATDPIPKTNVESLN